MRVVWLISGLVSLALGLIGAVLPLLPTVPLLLLATFCFARSSERLHRWLTEHPKFGPPIYDWQENGAIRPKAKKLATLSIVAVFLISVVSGLKPVILVIQALILTCVLIFIWSRPNG